MTACKPRKRKFPVLDGKPVYPVAKAACPECAKPFKGSFVVFTSGAMRVVSKKNKSATVAHDCIGFLRLFVHPRHDKEPYDAGTTLTVADNTPSGQFDLMFCSVECLRSFLSSMVDALEAKRNYDNR